MVQELATRKLGISAGDRIGNPATIDRDTDWFGIPTELVSKQFDEEVRYANRSKMEKLLTYTTPYLTPIFNNSYERSKNPYSHFNTSDIALRINANGIANHFMFANDFINNEPAPIRCFPNAIPLKGMANTRGATHLVL